jgi:hypothetical protein
MPTGRIPPLVIDQWKKVKKDLIPTIEKMKGQTVTSAYRAELKKKAQTVFDTFDDGLRDKMKKANDAKTDAQAKTALAEVVKVSTDYLAKLKTTTSDWGTNGKGIKDIIEKNLKRIKETAQTAHDAIH